MHATNQTRASITAPIHLFCLLFSTLYLSSACDGEKAKKKDTGDSAADTGETATDTDTGDSGLDSEDSGKDTADTGEDTEDTEDTVVPGPVTPLAYADVRLYGETTHDGEIWEGWTLAGLGDTNGDGHDDLIIGPFLHYIQGPLAAGSYLLSEFPNEAGGYIVTSFSMAGPLDGNADGLMEALIGCESFHSAFLLLGSVDGLNLDISHPSESSQVQAFVAEDGDWGQEVASAGDVDADGTDDVLIATRWSSDASAGAVALFTGPFTGGTLAMDEAYATLHGPGSVFAGEELNGLGDLDGDGMSDIGVLTRAAAYIVFSPGSGTAMLSDADVEVRFPGTPDPWPTSITGLGDMDGDGLDDIAIGSLSYYETGAVFVFYATTLEGMIPSAEDADAILEGEIYNSWTGVSLAGGEDLDLDSTPDIVVGSWGMTYVVPGPVAGRYPLEASPWRFEAEEDGSAAGYALDLAGDIDGDGRPDILIGDDGWCDWGCDYHWKESPGAAYVVFGASL